MKAKYIVTTVAVLAIAGGALWFFMGKKKTGGNYRTTAIERGDIVQTVRASGLVQPVRLVQVGTQVNGPITKLYVDFNDLVKEGQLVAQIDPTVYEAQLARDEANLRQSEASVDQAKARLIQAQKELERSEELAKRDMVSKADLESAVAERDSLAAQLKVAEASVEQSNAALSLSTANLSYTTIKSPVDGVVVSRNVNEGQTVVASMSAQVLFLVATDLKDIQVEASIPEADIGRVRLDQPVSFTVDAYEQEFTGRVSQIRLAASTVQNVVTYPVVVRADNPDGKLFPGMTANIVCEIARRTNVLRLPNAALRFKMSQDTSKDRPAPEKRDGIRVWVQNGSGRPPFQALVQTGISDGSFTEVIEAAKVAETGGEDTLRQGDKVIVGIASATAEASTTVNPFTPQMPGRNRQQPRR